MFLLFFWKLLIVEGIAYVEIYFEVFFSWSNAFDWDDVIPFIVLDCRYTISRINEQFIVYKNGSVWIQKCFLPWFHLEHQGAYDDDSFYFHIVCVLVNIFFILYVFWLIFFCFYKNLYIQITLFVNLFLGDSPKINLELSFAFWGFFSDKDRLLSLLRENLLWERDVICYWWLCLLLLVFWRIDWNHVLDPK